MKSYKTWTVIGLLFLALGFLASCRAAGDALEAMRPATIADIQEATEANRPGSESGNPFSGILYGLGTLVLSVTGALKANSVLSSKRRASPQNDIETAKRVKRGEVLMEAKARMNGSGAGSSL